MWRRTYLALVLLRLYFAVSPSYLHPDEHFQGPEVIAGTHCTIQRVYTRVTDPVQQAKSFIRRLN